MIDLIFATNNINKVVEIKKVVGNKFNIITLEQAGILIDIPEPYNTLQQNALEKSKTIYTLTNKNCFGEDTGLEVHALNGEPGVLSARYAGVDKDFAANVHKLLLNLENKTNRNAQFRTVISLIINGAEYLFEGICEGSICTHTKGLSGFGYDPVFIPNGSNKTFAEMSLEEKNIYSHRRKATDKLLDFLAAY